MLFLLLVGVNRRVFDSMDCSWKAGGPGRTGLGVSESRADVSLMVSKKKKEDETVIDV